MKTSWLSLGAALVLGGALVVPASAGGNGFDSARKGFGVESIIDAAGEGAREAAEVPGAVMKGAPGVAADQVERRIVVFKKGTPRARRLSVVRAAGASVSRELWLIDAVAVITPKTKAAILDRDLLAFAEVKRVERDHVRNWLYAEPQGAPAAKGCPPWWPPDYPCPFPDEPGGGDGKQSVPWGVNRVNAPKAWAASRGKGVKVAVIDTGIDKGHSELKVLGGFSAIGEGSEPVDGHGHGTHVAGTIAAADNDKGVVGVAPQVDLYAVRVLDARGSGSYESVIAGIQWAVENKMDVANMSLGGDETTPAMEDAVKAAAAAGLVIVAAAGNNGGKVGYPAAYPETIAISASDSGDRIAGFSSRGPEVDLIAPGVQVNSTWKGGGYRKLDGTSMACPHAAGLAALAVASQGVRGLGAVRAALQAAAKKLPGLSDAQQGAGLVDAESLVKGSHLAGLPN